MGGILGLDFSSATLRLALCRRGALLGAASVDIPEGLVREGRLTSAEALAQLLRKAAADFGLRARRAAIVAPHELCVLRSLRLPPMNGRLLRKSLPYEFSEFLSGELDDYVYDYALVPDPRADAMEVTAAAFPKEALGQLSDAVRRAGMLLTRVAPAESACRALVRRAGELSGEGEFCFLDLDFSLPRMFLFRGERHMATHVLDAGQRPLAEAVAAQFGVDAATASGYLLNNYGDCRNREYSAGIYRSMTAELTRALDYFRYSNPGSALKGVWVCGDGVVLRPLMDSLAEALGPNLRLAEELVPGSEALPDGFRYVRAAGIAMDWR
ncbi:MAG: pilus assembly protein PilM [Oscillospiraceae bacterium]|nr:pilus assembly protein PilM [Oscillospiraceae bacterium]